VTQRLGAILAVITLAIVAVFWFIGWAPATSNLTHARANVTAADAKTTQLSGEVATLLAAEKKAPLYESQLKVLQQAVPSDPAFAQVIDQLTAVSNSSGVSISSVIPSVAPATSTTSGPATMMLTLAVTGTYPQVLSFITDLDHESRLYVITSLGLSSDGHIVTASVDARVFYSDANAAPGSGS
jgi:Tfp pilus assembly protein PilO